MRQIKNQDFFRKKTLRALIIIALFSFYAFNILLATPDLLNKIENNCIWVKHTSISDSSKVDSLINFIINNRINKIFLETFTNGELKYYKSDVVENNDSLMIPFNSLDYFSNRLRENELVELYAWVDAYKIWDKNFYPEDPQHFYYQCPECLESDLNNRSDRVIRLDKIQSLEWEGVFLSPIHPRVNNYLLGIFNDIINAYDFDGILIDYIRYQDYYYGYNSIGLENFEEEYSFNPLDLNRGIISERFGYSRSEIDSLNMLWNNYRVNGINHLLYQLNNTINKDSLDFKIITSVKISPFDSVNKWYQDWSYWLTESLVDYVVVNNYYTDFYEFNYYNTIIERKYTNLEYLNKIIIGMNLYDINPVNIGNKILSIRLSMFSNISLYPYDEYENMTNWYIPIYKAINFNLNND